MIILPDVTGILAAIGAAYAAIRTVWLAIQKMRGK